MRALSLDFHGVGAVISCNDDDVLEDLRRDFEFFSHKKPAAPTVTVELRLAPPPPSPRGRPLLKRAHFAAYDRGATRVVAHPKERALTTLDFSTESAVIQCAEPAPLRELGYLLVCSRVGYQLDLRGFHRVHALGVAREERGVLVVLPSGGGKTRLCLELLRRGDALLLSEDTPLLGPDGRLWPFPLRLGLNPDEDRTGIPSEHCRTLARSRHGPKVLVDLPYFHEQLSGPIEPGLLVAGRRGPAERPSVRQPARRSAAAALLSALVVGIGTPQLTEYMLRVDAGGVFALAKIAASRARALAALITRCKTATVEFGTDRSANAEALVGLMDQAFL